MVRRNEAPISSAISEVYTQELNKTFSTNIYGMLTGRMAGLPFPLRPASPVSSTRTLPVFATALPW